MIGILKAKLPDNFKKGQCGRCPFSYDGHFGDLLCIGNGDGYDCPLEIQDYKPIRVQWRNNK